MNPFVADEENASEYPQIYHCNMTTALHTETAQINERADFLRTKPPYKKAKYRYTNKVDVLIQRKNARHLTETRHHE